MKAGLLPVLCTAEYTEPRTTPGHIVGSQEIPIKKIFFKWMLNTVLRAFQTLSCAAPTLQETTKSLPGEQSRKRVLQGVGTTCIRNSFERKVWCLIQENRIY